MSVLLLNTWVEKNLFFLTAGFLFCLILLFIHALIIRKKLKKYQIIFKGYENKDLETILINMAEKVELFQKNVANFETRLKDNEQKSEIHFQKWHLLRFKAFENSGGDQSFALALLDGSGDGVVLSSIFGREESRVYCKTVREGKSTYALSGEEQEAIIKALGKNSEERHQH
ncbi:uncharacterized protein DUF4446 [Hydrogenispora ethanolica]|jgi:hypothetical protein|uniref:Uncharacterized protein DUF4446 n=1 Tax=Hydrogenispora ethanolica TaxID=1082276 RepID=A0A4R1SBE5_HYDET|nr:DUF4446 family protein [Hydrogenispora ethanolica]TCL76320.1 uncharacterized protein DUF4446 [Hydrogenispora ethanolica]